MENRLKMLVRQEESTRRRVKLHQKQMGTLADLRARAVRERTANDAARAQHGEEIQQRNV